MSKVKLEVCVDNAQSIQNAVMGKADRLELCSSLILGGLTPSIGFAEYACRYSNTPCYALIRARNGNFVFSDEEIHIMEQDIHRLKQVGVQGFVIGALNAEGEIDENALIKFIQAAKGCDLTFHRAFDLVKDPLESMERLIELGFSRILTSGQQQSAIDGIELIALLQKKAAGRISIMAGAGVNENNAEFIISQTQIREIHGSFKLVLPSENLFESSASMGAESAYDKIMMITDYEKIVSLNKILSKIN